MAPNIIKKNLREFRGNQSTLFTGRPQGTQAREKLKLDELDKDSNLKVVFEIPEDTTSFNPSFFLGMLFPSIKSLGVEKFKNKYSFEIKTLNINTKKVILENIEDGMRNALNVLNNKTGLWSFIK